MKTIHKFHLALLAHQPHSIWMPDGAEILSVGEQDNSLVVWAIVDQDAPKVTYQFAVYGTGQPLPLDFDHNRKGNRFLGTVQQGPYVWHVFLAED